MTEIKVRIENVPHVRTVTSGAGNVMNNDAKHYMGISFGVLGDLFWLTLPEMRPILNRMLMDELNSAIEQNRETYEISPYEICSEFRDKILEPALENITAATALAQRSCATLGQIVKIYPSLDQLIRNALGIRIFERVIMDPIRSRMSRVDSDLVDNILAIEGPISGIGF